MNSVLITGATSGIGKQLAKDFADAGAKVIACGRNRQVLQELEDYSPAIATISFDVTDYQQTREALSVLPFIPNVWIFNAGDCEYMDDGIVDAPLMQRVLSVNVFGVVHCLEASPTPFPPGELYRGQPNPFSTWTQGGDCRFYCFGTRPAKSGSVWRV